MNHKKSLFIVIEGLDGSGKTSASRRMAEILDAHYPGKIKLTYEPHDPSCAGLFIRQVLKKKITRFSPRVLALAYAANRLDHGARTVEPWLDEEAGRMILCDRYYLSSLVYQSAENFPFQSVMTLNEKARKPDIIFFLNVSNEVCYERMNIRNQPRELFEGDLSTTRIKYRNAIDFLRKKHNDYIVEIDGSGTIEEVVGQMLAEIYRFAPDWRPENPVPSVKLTRTSTILNGGLNYSLTDAAKELKTLGALTDKKTTALEKEAEAKVAALNYRDLASLLLSYVDSLGIKVVKKMPLLDFNAYELAYQTPAGINFRGAALLLPEPQGYSLILQTAPDLLADFILVFCPGPSELVNNYYERDRISYHAKNDPGRLFPSVRLITQKDLAKAVLQYI